MGSEFDNIVSKRHKLQDINNNQLKLEVHDTYEEDGKLTTNFEPINIENVINKGYLDHELLKMSGHLSSLEKVYNELKLQYNKQSVEGMLVQESVKTTIQIIYDKGLFDDFAKSDKVLEDFSFTTNCKAHLEEVNADIQCFFLINTV